MKILETLRRLISGTGAAHPSEANIGSSGPLPAELKSTVDTTYEQRPGQSAHFSDETDTCQDGRADQEYACEPTSAVAASARFEPLTGRTAGELQDQPFSAWGNADILIALEFHATMQLRTPLRVLQRNGAIHSDPETRPPKFAHEEWEGMWVAKPRSFADMVIGTSEEARAVAERLDAGFEKMDPIVASNIGPVSAREYLPFLMAVRGIVEADASIDDRITQLRQLSIPSEWRRFWFEHGAADGLIDFYFPRFMSLGPDLNTPNKIAAASDQRLLAIKGIGPVKLRKIREYCNSITRNRDCDRLDNVRT